MKISPYFIVLLSVVLFSCRKEKPIKYASWSESFPPGWKAYETSHEFSFSGIALNHADDIWCYNFNHLYKMTGSNFKDYSSFVTPSLRPTSSQISSLDIDKNDNVWMAIKNQGKDSSHAGLIRFDGVNCQAYNLLNSGLHNNDVTEVVVDSKNVKWLGTENSLIRYDDTTWSYYNASNSSLTEYYPLLSAFGSVWVTGRYSLKKIDGPAFQNWDASNSSFPASGMRIADADGAGNIWFLGYADTMKLWKFDGSVFSSVAIPVSYKLPGVQLSMLRVDSSNNIWLGGYGSLFKFDGINWHKYAVPSFFTGGDPRLPHANEYIQSNFLDMVIKSDGSKWLLEKYFSNRNIMTFQE